ncbi:hypothetical protein Tco_0037830 [Tanacetum coccineum]
MNDGIGIKITPKMIQDMIRILMGSIVVTEVPTTTTKFPHIVKLRQTYNTYTDARDCPKLGTVNQLFLECVANEENIRNMDWCTYLLGTMKKTRKEYKESQGFGGPLLLMVLMYVHATISERVVVEDQTPLMKSWDTMKLKLKENEELDMGGIWKVAL